MSEKGKARRAAYQARQEKEGKNVVKWILGILILLAVCIIAYSMFIMS